ncbi:hypothetical protein P4O66_008533, partial [Electrophorus voltai]
MAAGDGAQLPATIAASRSVEKSLEEAALSGALVLSNRKLKEFPRTARNYDLSDITHADLSKNRLCELPEEVCQFISLETLSVYHNCVRSLPSSLCQLQALTYLNLSRNQLSSLPLAVCQLPLLRVLNLSNNKLSLLPASIHTLTHLRQLDVSCNELQSLPMELGQLESLRDLNLRRNQLTTLPEAKGSLLVSRTPPPAELSELPLVRLDVSCNRISRVPVCYRHLRHLQTIILDNNPLQMPPAQICSKGKIHFFKYLNMEACKRSHDQLERVLRPSGFNTCLSDQELFPGQYGGLDSGFNSVDSGSKRWSGNESADDFSERSLRLAEISRERTNLQEEEEKDAPQDTPRMNGDLEQVDFIDSSITEEEDESSKHKPPTPAQTSPPQGKSDSSRSTPAHSPVFMCSRYIWPPQCTPHLLNQFRPPSLFSRCNGPPSLFSRCKGSSSLFTRCKGPLSLFTRRNGPLSLFTRRNGPLSPFTRRNGPLSPFTRRNGPPSPFTRRNGPPSPFTRRNGPLSPFTRRNGPLSPFTRRNGPLSPFTRRNGPLSPFTRRNGPPSPFTRRNGPPSLFTRRNGPLSLFTRRKGPLSLFTRRKGPPSPFTRRKGPPSPFTRRKGPPSPFTRRPPSLFTRRNGPLSPFTRRNGLPLLFTRRNGPLSPFTRCNGPLSPFTRRNGPLSLFTRRKGPPSPFTRCKGPPSPFTRCRGSSTPFTHRKGPPSPFTRRKGPPSPFTRRKGPPSPFTRRKGPPSPFTRRKGPPSPSVGSESADVGSLSSPTLEERRRPGTLQLWQDRERAQQQRDRERVRDSTSQKMAVKTGSQSAVTAKQAGTGSVSGGDSTDSSASINGLRQRCESVDQTCLTFQASSLQRSTSRIDVPKPCSPTGSAPKPNSFLFRTSSRCNVKNSGSVQCLADSGHSESRSTLKSPREERADISHLRKSLESRLKITLSEDLGDALANGAVLCQLVNHIRPRSVSIIHIPSPAVPKLSAAKCRLNVENFVTACRRLGVPETEVCLVSDILCSKLRAVHRCVEALLVIGGGEELKEEENALPLPPSPFSLIPTGFLLFYCLAMTLLYLLYCYLT